MGYRDGIAFSRDMREGEVRHDLDIGNTAVRLAERCALDLGKALEPADAHGADRLIAVIANHMRRLQIVAIERVVER